MRKTTRLKAAIAALALLGSSVMLSPGQASADTQRSNLKHEHCDWFGICSDKDNRNPTHVYSGYWPYHAARSEGRWTLLNEKHHHQYEACTPSCSN